MGLHPLLPRTPKGTLMSNDEHRLPNTYRGIKDKYEPPASWTNLPEGYEAVPMDHASDLEAAMAESVNTAALSIDHASRGDTSTAAVRSADLCSEGFDAERLRQLVACLAICLHRAHRENRADDAW